MRRFELAVEIGRAADEAHRGHAEAMAVEGLLGRLDEIGMIGKAEIIIGAEIQHLAAAGATSMRPHCGDRIGRSVFHRLCGLDVFEFGGNVVENGH